MCGPMEAMMALQVIGGIQQQNNAVAMANQQNALYTANANNAKTAQLDEVRALNNRQTQEGEAKAQKSFQNTIDNLKTQGTLQVAAGEAGLAGMTPQRIFDQYERQSKVQQGTINRNFDNIASQLDLERTGTKATFNNRVNSVGKGYAPSAFDAGLGIATKVGSTYLTAEAAAPKGGSVWGKWIN